MESLIGTSDKKKSAILQQALKNIIYLSLIAITINGCKDMKKEKVKSNRLIQESSPYLLQHAYNPVDWYPWGQEALAKAKQEDKMLLISIGYAACHWCHVMEHESFEDSLVASIMNENFVCIKVDREERPDVDDVYMTACQLAGGRSCGWPLNAFALPDGRPVWAGTYFPKENWVNILNQFADLKVSDPARLKRAAESITKGISQFGALEATTENRDFNKNELQRIVDSFLSSIDLVDGGRQGAPKFPMPNNYEFLLKYYYTYEDKRALDAVQVTLDKMAEGGIYDQIGGGFARYSVDPYWKVPHFEKMLYDNGQLLGLYADAYKVTQKPRYLQVVEETIQFVKEYMQDEKGGFYSSYDADSEGEEGMYYTWEVEELKDVLGEDYPIVAAYYSVLDTGNWEGRNILHRTRGLDELVKDFSLHSTKQLLDIIERAKVKLRKRRDKREMPGLDDKVLASWNGLMLSGIIKSYKATGKEEYLDLALQNAAFIESYFIKKDGRMDRNYKEGKSTINAFLDDYANVIKAFTELYQVTFTKRWLLQAKKLMAYCEDNFWNEEEGMFDYTNKQDPPLVAKTRNYSDNVIPAANSTMARNYVALGIIFSDDAMITKAEKMLSNVLSLFVNNSQSSFYSNWLQLYLEVMNRPYEVAIVGGEAMRLQKEMAVNYLPNAIFIGGDNEDLPLLENKLVEGETYIYVCQNKVCKLPVSTTQEALKVIR